LNYNPKTDIPKYLDNGMATKVNRDIALIRFRKLPLLEYDDKIDTEVFYYPRSFSFHWIKLEKLTNNHYPLVIDNA